MNSKPQSGKLEPHDHDQCNKRVTELAYVFPGITFHGYETQATSAAWNIGRCAAVFYLHATLCP